LFMHSYLARCDHLSPTGAWTACGRPASGIAYLKIDREGARHAGA
jgi:hypothetical protein